MILRNISFVIVIIFVEVVKVLKNFVVVVLGKDVVGGSFVDDIVIFGFVVMDVDDVVVVEFCVVLFDFIVFR